MQTVTERSSWIERKRYRRGIDEVSQRQRS